MRITFPLYSDIDTLINILGHGMGLVCPLEWETKIIAYQILKKISQVIFLWNGRKTTHLRSKHVFIYGKIFIILQQNFQSLSLRRRSLLGDIFKKLINSGPGILNQGLPTAPQNPKGLKDFQNIIFQLFSPGRLIHLAALNIT